MTEIKTGDGWAVASLDALGEGPGFRKIRTALGVKEFGVNAIVMPPGISAGVHWHERQEELYFVHRGTIEIELGEEGNWVRLGPGALARVDPATPRRVRNSGDEEAVYVVVGAQGGYVGRDGVAPQGSARVQQA